MSDNKKHPTISFDDILETIQVSGVMSSTHYLQIPERFKPFIDSTRLTPMPIVSLYGYEVLWQGDSVDVIKKESRHCRCLLEKVTRE